MIYTFQKCTRADKKHMLEQVWESEVYICWTSSTKHQNCDVYFSTILIYLTCKLGWEWEVKIYPP